MPMGVKGRLALDCVLDCCDEAAFSGRGANGLGWLRHGAVRCGVLEAEGLQDDFPALRKLSGVACMFSPVRLSRKTRTDCVRVSWCCVSVGVGVRLPMEQALSLSRAAQCDCQLVWTLGQADRHALVRGGARRARGPGTLS